MISTPRTTIRPLLSRIASGRDSTGSGRTFLSYNKSFGKHNLGALVGTSMSAFSSSNIWGTDYNLLVVDINKAFIDTATASEDQSKVGSSGYDHRLASAFGRVNYNYEEKYMLEAVLRRDGSSNFGRKHQWGIFPSVSFGWVITKENFLASKRHGSTLPNSDSVGDRTVTSA